ncbi:unnamed protein product [Thelazia callipaeda]|uniref:Lysophosphatidylserine lipase ABHD12 n=1 Tax=Thelazia callipaeda TaxID=103827 RepID=A0A0N5D6F0_THECL|nr:unnamed protein product [Thelazia callipaeda]
MILQRLKRCDFSVKVPFQDYNNLTYHGVNSIGRNFHLVGKNGLRLGCWHILPDELSLNYKDTVINSNEMEHMMETFNYSIIVYLHGNSFDRSQSVRCKLYNVLSALGFHVLAIDYQGYGDSSGYPSEDGLIENAKEIYRYARSHCGSNNIYIWGHSLGTAESGSPPLGLILESPFNNLRDVVANHPFATFFRCLPWFERTVLDSLNRSGLNMSTDVRITKVDCPILILHAEDDHVIPVRLGRKLRDSALASHRDVIYEEFSASRHFSHKFIYLAEELPEIVT